MSYGNRERIVVYVRERNARGRNVVHRFWNIVKTVGDCQSNCRMSAQTFQNFTSSTISESSLPSSISDSSSSSSIFSSSCFSSNNFISSSVARFLLGAAILTKWDFGGENTRLVVEQRKWNEFLEYFCANLNFVKNIYSLNSRILIFCQFNIDWIVANVLNHTKDNEEMCYFLSKN